MDTTAALTAVEALLATLPVEQRETLLDAVELYGDLRADEARSA